ncbi:hypothetical protein LTR59_013431 [Friedmanniomyces endolithicus]|nr:hypothetical protein LTR94_003544 [Friedmanniomyces endolithicus]KAK0778694.1 hypothetical protein LTR59_013431 [Friedmanniomyces endolithicus]KAK0785882.1 hypothetical protein LTR38_012186 [Friedmanniomyces endolithicus]
MSQNHLTSENIARLASRIPNGTWDTHMHVVDPRAFPLSKDAQYQPSPHTLDDAHAFLNQLGIQKMVIVQPSIYSNDNACTLDGLRRLGSKNGRAVVQFDPETTSREQLREWHDLGVRGVRLNFKSVGGKVEQAALTASMRRYADAVRELGWVLELYIALEDVPLLEKAMAEELGLKVCVDHFGHPSPESMEKAKKAQDLPGFDSLVRLLERGQTWVKVSASYRLSRDPTHPIVESLCREILKTRPDRCVFATDWPHTRFDGLDVVPYLDAVLDAIEAEGISLQQVLRTFTTSRPAAMRLPYIDDDPKMETPEDEAVVQRVKERRGGKLIALDKALLHAPPVADGWNSFLKSIRTQTTLTDSVRELAISRVAALNQAWYEWDAHAPLLKKTKVLSDETVEKIKDKSWSGEGLDEKHAAVLEYTDAMTVGCDVKQAKFDKLKGLFKEREVVEITATVAAYNCVSRFLVALDVGEMAEKYGVDMK